MRQIRFYVILLFESHIIKKWAISYSPVCTVPSALQGFTSLFGMGRGRSTIAKIALNN